MAENIKRHVTHIKSKVVEEGLPKLPTAAQLKDGEIAVNYAKGYETLSIKNESGDVVTFSSDNYYSEKKLGSGFTGANSAKTVTEALENIEIDVDQVLDDTTSASTNAVSSKAVYKAMTDNELVWTNAYVALSGVVSSHTSTTAIHMDATEKENLDSLEDNIATISGITAADVAKWNSGTDLTDYYKKSETSGKTEISTALAGKSDTGHTHVIGDVTDLQTTLNEKTNNTAFTSHTSDTTIHFTTGAVQTQIDNSISGKVDTSDFNTHTGNTDIHVTASDKTSWNNAATNSHTHTNKAALDSITGSVGTMAYQNTSAYSSATEVNTALGKKSDTGHTHAISDVTDLQTTLNDKADTTAVTQSINAATSGKVDTSTYETYTAATNTLIGSKFGGANYDSNTKRINFYASSSKTGTVIDYIDATDFIKDGMVSNVEISGGSLVITFNEDSGKETISIPLTDIFNPNNYYTKSETSGKTEIANLVGSGFTDTTITDAIIANELTVSNALNDLNTNKADKDHTHAISGVTGLQDALDGKQASGDYVTNATFTAYTAVTTGLTATEKQNLDSLATNIGTISGITSTNVTSWNNAATNSHTHTNKAALDSITGSVGTMAYQNTSAYSSATQVNTALGGKSDTGHTHVIGDVTDLQTTLNGKADTATTLGGYGITDAKIENGVITLGNQTITPLTSYTAPITSVTTSTTNGSISVNGSDVAVHGLGGAAYLNTGTTAGTVAAGDHTHSEYVPTGRTITTASGLTGGGNLSTNRTIGLAATGTSGTYAKVVTDAYGRVTSGNSMIEITDVNALQTALDGKQASGSYLTATTTYAGSSSVGGAATSANKLNTNAGNTTTPVYFSGGVPVALSYTIEKSVPSDAKFTDTTYSAATALADGLMPSTDKAKSDEMGMVTFGTCDTAAATAAKEVTISNTNWQLKVGSIIGVKFANINSATNVTLDVGGTGAKQIYYSNSVFTGSTSTVCGAPNVVIYYMYDGTYWVWMNYGVYQTITDEKVKQVHRTTNNNYPVILKYNTTTASTVNTVYFSSGVTVNPSTKTITADNFVGKINGNNLGGAAYLNTGTTAGTVAAGNHTHSEYVPTGRTVSAGTGLSGGGALSSDITLNLAMPTTYSASTYTSTAITSSEPIVYALVKASSNLANQVCPVTLVDGQQCNVIYMGAVSSDTYTVSISTNYKTPTGSEISSLTVPANGYVEVNYINIKGVIFVRGV